MEKLQEAVVNTCLESSSADLAVRGALEALQDPSQSIESWLPAAAEALQRFWISRTPSHSWWKRQAVAELLDRGLPKASVARLLGVGPRGIESWAAATPETLEFSGVEISVETTSNQAQIRESLIACMSNLQSWVAWGYETAQEWEQAESVNAADAVEVIAASRMAPGAELQVAKTLHWLHAAGVSSASLGRLLGISGSQVQVLIGMLGIPRRRVLGG